MKRILPLLLKFPPYPPAVAVFLCLLCATLAGCGAVNSNTPVAALAPGYSSAADQALGEGLAAVNSFVNQEKINYAAETPAVQAIEKATLNNLIMATNLANVSYTAFHSGTGTLPAAQQALTTAQNAQAALASQKGVK